jgi:S1-C subfamily serine protease
LTAVLLVLAACRATVTEEPNKPHPAGVTVSPLPAIDPGADPIVQVVERVRPAVVNVRSEFSQGQGEGTGFIIRRDGVIVTNDHVVDPAVSITVITSDGKRFQARAIGGDREADLAVLKIDSRGLPTVRLGDSDRLDLGESVVALGFALGLEGGPSVTSGIVSATGRTITAGDQSGGPQRRYEDLIQTDAAINPGNSGGPLVDLSGQVVGINTAGVPAAQGENIGFAISINRARPIIDHAIADPQAPVAYLGVSTTDVNPAVAAQLGLSVDRGALVEDLVGDGPAARGGIQQGDVIVAIGGSPVADSNDVLDRLLEHDPGDTVTVTVVRGSQTLDLDVTLGTRAAPIG